MANEKEILEQAHKLIKSRQFDRARLVLGEIPDNRTAQLWLDKLEQVDPEPTTFEEAQEELAEARAELGQAEVEIGEAKRSARRLVNVNVALLVFLGSLLGSLLGAAADLGDALDTAERLEEYFYPKLCIVGSDTILGDELGLADAWVDEFKDDHDVKIDVAAIGSGNGVRRAVNGDCAHLLAMSEPMSDAQYEQLVDAGVEVACAAEIGYDIIVFITDINNTIEIVDDNALQKILTGKETNWNAILNTYDFPITIFVRQGSGTTDVVLSNFARIDDTQGGTVFPEDADYQICDSNADCLNQTLSTPGSLYWLSAAWMRTQPERYLRVLSVLQGDEVSVNPLREQVNLSRYPRSLLRPLYMYVLKSDDTGDKELDLARNFIHYIRGVQGQEILDRYFYTYFNQPSDIDVPLPPGFEPAGTTGRNICDAPTPKGGGF